ncbi:MAG: TVP38/TMEM64 family protein [Rhodoferax sp.]|nr:TVP38/TMEM64 family protein [Rhodoferax sp.]
MKLKTSKSRALLVLLLLLAAGLIYGYVDGVRTAVDHAVRIMTMQDSQSAIQAFRDYLLSFGSWAALVSAVIMVFQSVAAPLPAFVVTFANGLLFGWAWGALLSWSSAMLGAVLCFWIARSLGRPVVEKLVGSSQALETWDLFFTRYGNRAILVSRLLPFVSFDVVSYGAGLTPITLWNFVWATGIGQLPATLLYSYLGQNLTGSIQVLFWIFSITIALFVLGSAFGSRWLKKLRAANAGQAPIVSGPAAEHEGVKP